MLGHLEVRSQRLVCMGLDVPRVVPHELIDLGKANARMKELNHMLAEKRHWKVDQERPGVQSCAS